MPRDLCSLMIFTPIFNASRFAVVVVDARFCELSGVPTSTICPITTGGDVTTSSLCDGVVVLPRTTARLPECCVPSRCRPRPSLPGSKSRVVQKGRAIGCAAALRPTSWPRRPITHYRSRRAVVKSWALPSCGQDDLLGVASSGVAMFSAVLPWKDGGSWAPCRSGAAGRRQTRRARRRRRCGRAFRDVIQ